MVKRSQPLAKHNPLMQQGQYYPSDVLKAQLEARVNGEPEGTHYLPKPNDMEVMRWAYLYIEELEQQINPKETS